MHRKLSQEIRHYSDILTAIVARIPTPQRLLPVIEGTGGKVSVADLIAYQIGWGKCVMRWYEAGIRGEQPDMPGEGFAKWDYTAIAKHFYLQYHYDGSTQQTKVFQEVVSGLIEIAEQEEQSGRLDQIGSWAWCTLSSGKQWPLSKWMRVNTVSPYKRAVQLLKKANNLLLPSD